MTEFERAYDKQSSAFLLGWAHGEKRTRLDTSRKVATRFPDMGYGDIAAFLNGYDDGRVGETFRLRLIHTSRGTA